MTVKNYNATALLLGVFACLPIDSLLADDEIDVGIFPRRGSAMTVKMFSPLVAYLGNKLGQKVRLHTSADFDAFWEDVSTNKYELVHFNQYHYLRSQKQFGYRVILKNEEFGQSAIKSAIFVRQDSGIESLPDLKGKKIVFGGGQMAMISYIVNTYLLQNSGLKKGDYLSQFALDPPKALVAMYYRQAEAAGGGRMLLEFPRIKEQLDIGEIKTIAEGPPLAHLPWAVSKQVSKEEAKRIQKILSTMAHDTEGRKALQSARLTNLVSSQDKDFDPHREIVKHVLGEDY